MDPASGTFTSMDTYAGRLSDPMSLHKYLFANSNPVMYSDPSGHSTSLTECNTTVAIITILAEVSAGVLYNIIGEINGVDRTKPGFWIGMFVTMILAAFLAYFVAGAFVAGVAICALGKLLLGLMGMIAGGILYKLSNTARVKGYNTYADLFEFASVLLQSYAFGEILEGVAEGFNNLKDKVKNAQPQMHNKKGYINFGSSNNNNEIKYVYKSIKDSPNYPSGFTDAKQTKKVNIHDKDILYELRKIESGDWKKVYKDGYDNLGNKISIHYFQSKSGQVFDVKVVNKWSNG